MSEIRVVSYVAIDERRSSVGLAERALHQLGRSGEVVTIDDGLLLSSFDGASAAVTAAIEVHRLVPELRHAGIGLDIGEFTTLDANSSAAAGAAGFARRAQPGKVFVSRTVGDLARLGAGVELSPIDDGTAGDAAYEIVFESEASPRRVVVADDAALIRSGVVQLLDASGFNVVGEAEDLDGLIEAVERTMPDLVVTDIRMPPTNTDEGLRAAADTDGAPLLCKQGVVGSRPISSTDIPLPSDCSLRTRSLMGSQTRSHRASGVCSDQCYRRICRAPS